MKRILFSIFLTINMLGVNAQNAYAIDLTVKPYKNTFVYLGYHYGEKKALADSVFLDANSHGILQGKEKLPGGIYFIVSPRKEVLFEVLLDKQQRFTITADTARLPEGVVFTGSADNQTFQQYTRFANTYGAEVARLNAAIQANPNAPNVASLRAQSRKASEQLQKFRDSLVNRYPASILTALFKAMREPVVPPAALHPGGKYDSNYAYQYYKSHYWDGVSFDDERLIRTPFFEGKLTRYYRDLVAPVPDSIIKEADRMILYARPSREMYKFMMVHFVQKYINPEFMGQDAVFVHLFEKYINTGQTDFFTPQYKEFMTKRAYSMMANLIGAPAADLDMVDSTDKPDPLYKVKAELVLVCFWDPTCGHCKETVPRIDSMYRAKWKSQGVVLYGVMTDGGKPNWISFIKEHKLEGWHHVYELPSTEAANNAAGRPSYRQLYDVYQTPILYLLDKDKRIIAKKLSFDQLDEVITLKVKKTSAP